MYSTDVMKTPRFISSYITNAYSLPFSFVVTNKYCIAKYNTGENDSYKTVVTKMEK